MTTGTFTAQDTQTFAAKLEAFGQTLTTGEQAVLTLIEQQLVTLVTSGADNDVQGYMQDLGDIAMIRQRELLHEAERLRTSVRTTNEQDGEPATDRAGLWQRIAMTLGQQAMAMAPRTTGQPATN